MKPEYFEGDEELMAAVKAVYENMEIRGIGEKDGLNYFLCWSHAEDYLAVKEFPETALAFLDEYK